MGQVLRNTELPTRTSFPKLYKVLTWGCLLYGLGVRGVHYFRGQSLWHDEAAVALNLMNRSYGELLRPLAYDQAAPPLFLWIEKALIQLMGPSEYALRLLPFLASLAALGIFFQLLQRQVSPAARPIAMGLFAASSYLVYFSAELKPYGVDVAVALFLFFVLTRWQGQSLSIAKQLALGTMGGLALWLSYPSIFVLAATELFHCLWTRRYQWRQLLRSRLLIYSIWLISFAGLYFGIIQVTLSNDVLVDSWGARYPQSAVDLAWLLDALGRFFYRPLGFKGVTEAIALLAFAIGCGSLWYQRRIQLMLWLLPFGITLAAGYAKQYPFRERLILFLVPFVVLTMAEGIAWALQHRQRWLKGLGVALLLTLVIGKAVDTGNRLINPQETFLRTDPIRPATEFIQAHWADTDYLYIAPRAALPFRYYAQRGQFASPRQVYGQQVLPDSDAALPQYLDQELGQFLNAERLWLLYVSRSKALPQPEVLLEDLTRYFQTDPKQVFIQTDVLASLYEPRASRL